MRASRPRTEFNTRCYLPLPDPLPTGRASRTEVALRPPTLIMRPLALVLLSIACSCSLAVQPHARLAHLALRTSSSRPAAPRKDLVASVAASPPSDSVIKAPPSRASAWCPGRLGYMAEGFICILKARLDRYDTSGIS